MAMIEVFENAYGVVSFHPVTEPRDEAGRKYWTQEEVLEAARSGKLAEALGFNPMQMITKGDEDPKFPGMFAKVVVSEVPEKYANEKERAAIAKARAAVKSRAA